VIAVAGSTGAVGVEFIKLMEERNTKVKELRLLASSRSAGKKQKFRGQDIVVQELTPDSFKGVDVAFFSAGGAQSKTFCPAAAAAGAVVIDNSSFYRMDPLCPLVVPEVNPEAAFEAPKGIIANPNCSTIIMNVAVYPIHEAVGVERVAVSTYQAASGAGAAAMEELAQQARDWVHGKPLTMAIFKRQYIWNLFSHTSKMDVTSGYNEEEQKMINETGKIFAGSLAAKKWPNVGPLGPQSPFGITATCVRVPTLRAHCESINLTLRNPITVERARELISKAKGVKLMDDRAANKFPEPIDASDKNDVLVGRLRNDLSLKNPALGLEMFVSGDQIRKGAALNGIQIMELLQKR
jgi:aspartate-semialdehyde dehydrogenase